MSRNLGAMMARTEFVAFLDDDDELDSRYLEAMVESIEVASTDVVYATVTTLGSRGEVTRQLQISDVPPASWLQRMYRHQNPGFGGGNLLLRRTDFLAIGGFPPSLLTAEDRAFAIATLRAGYRAAHAPRAVVRCHTSGPSSASHHPTRWLSWLKITSDNWDDMSWSTRAVSLARTLKATLGHVKRGLLQRP